MIHEALGALRAAIRRAATTRRITVTVVATLGIAIGLATIVFSFLNGYLWRALPWEDPATITAIGAGRAGRVISDPDIEAALDVARSASGITEAGAWRRSGMNVVFGDGLARVDVAEVTASWFATLRARPRVGRFFTDGEAAAGERVAIIAETLWRSRFDSAPDVVGRTVRIDGEATTIIGVAPDRFVFDRETMWIPMLDRSGSGRVLARLARGTAFDIAAAQVTAAAAAPGGRAENVGNMILSRDPVRRAPAGIVVGFFGLFIAATVFVLLIASSNVISLLLAAGETRRADRAVRAVLGATRTRIFGASMAESFVLAAGAAILGFLISLWGTDLIVAIVPNGMPRWIRFGVDLRVIAFVISLAIITTLMIGLLPARDAMNGDVGLLLKSGSLPEGDARTARRRRFMIGTEMACSAALVTATLLAWRTSHRFEQIDTGFDADRTLAVEAALSGSRYPTPSSQSAYYDQAAARVVRLPGVERVAIEGRFHGFIGDADPTTAFRAEAADGGSIRRGIETLVVDTNYLAVTRLPLRRGRFFDERDVAGAPYAAVISERAANELFGAEDPIGREIRFDTTADRWLTVIGVVGNRISLSGGFTIRPEEHRTVLLSSAQANANPPRLIVRGPLDPLTITPLIRSELLEVDAEQPMLETETLQDEMIGGAASVVRIFGGFMGTFGVAGLLLALVGLYGLMAHSTARRTREIGVRMALGAAPSDISSHVIREALGVTAAGLAAGLALTIALTRIAGRFLFGFAIERVDPAAYAITALVFAIVAITAAWLPALRATRIDPLAAIRSL